MRMIITYGKPGNQLLQAHPECAAKERGIEVAYALQYEGVPVASVGRYFPMLTATSVLDAHPEACCAMCGELLAEAPAPFKVKEGV